MSVSFSFLIHDLSLSPLPAARMKQSDVLFSWLSGTWLGMPSSQLPRVGSGRGWVELLRWEGRQWGFPRRPAPDHVARSRALHLVTCISCPHLVILSFLFLLPCNIMESPSRKYYAFGTASLCLRQNLKEKNFPLSRSLLNRQTFKDIFKRPWTETKKRLKYPQNAS